MSAEKPRERGAQVAEAKRRRWPRRLAIALGLCVLGVFVVLVALQRSLLFPRHMLSVAPNAGDGVPGLERLWIDSDEGRVEAWFLPGDGVSAQKPGPAVIFAHGNGELIDHWPQTLAGYRRLGISVLLPEYRGYGRSAGSPSQERIESDFVRFHALLTKRPEVDATRLLYHGRSLGGGAVCTLAARRPPRAMILMSTFTSVRQMARRFWVPGFVVRDPFDNLAVVEKLKLPIFVLHGDADELIPVEHGKRLAEAAKQSEIKLYPGQPHNFWPRSFFTDVEPFLRRVGILR